MTPTRRRLAFVAIALAATALRVYRLGADSLWYDETVSVYLAGSSVPELLRHTAADIHPPGYYLLLRGWLLLMGYGDGRADPGSIGLEWSAAFLSLAAGLLLVAVVYAAGRRVAGQTAGLAAAALVAVSPYNVWYGQEVRMYTWGALAAALATYTLMRAIAGRDRRRWWAAYAAAAGAGMYLLHYFAFFLVAANICVALIVLLQRRRSAAVRWLAANVAALLLYLPWLPVAWRQAFDPPVPPWRTVPSLLAALRESVVVAALGQSAPDWALPVALLLLGVALLGLWGMRRNGAAAGLVLSGSFGATALLLGLSLVTPLYHVRYLFTYSAPFYVAAGAGIAWLGRRARSVGVLALALFAVAAVPSLAAYWGDPAYRADDHRSAVAALAERWRPGDAVLVNAGYAYPALITYWPGEIAARVRLGEGLPPAGDAPVLLMTGHLDGPSDLGWNDALSDFFPQPAGEASAAVRAAVEHYGRLWQYRIYDTVNDPNGAIRSELERSALPFEDMVFAGEANMRLVGYVWRSGREPSAGPAGAAFPGAELRFSLPEGGVASGSNLYVNSWWKGTGDTAAPWGVSLRLLSEDETSWAQHDEQPLGSRLTRPDWPAGIWLPAPLILPVPDGTPPGNYALQLVAYDGSTGRPLAPVCPSAPACDSGSVRLGRIAVAAPEPGPLRPRLARFGPLALAEARTPAAVVSPGDAVPVELLWQAIDPPSEPLVVVVQLLDGAGRVAAGIEEGPNAGRSPGTERWGASELTRDRHTLTVPAGLPPGEYRLIVGVYRGSDRVRLRGTSGLFGSGGDSFVVRTLRVR